MKKWNIQVFFIGTAFCSLQAFATLEHINGKNFVENGLNISYPCTAGGEPLVIYSTEVHNKKPISSKNKIVPVYTKTGFIGTPIEVSPYAQSDELSNSNLIINSSNPATEGQYVKFSLQKIDGSFFYTNSINFASAAVSPSDKIVFNYKIFLDNSKIHGFLPKRLYSFQQDIGINIFQNTQKIDAFQYAWNQNTAWSDYLHPTVSSNIHYNFSPQKTDDPKTYNGLGFWICGSENSQ